MSERDYVEIIAHVRLRDPARPWDGWLHEHALKLSDFHGDEVAQNVGRGFDGKSYSMFRIRRSALERLLPGEYGPKRDRSAALNA